MKSKYTRIFLLCTIILSLSVSSCTEFLTENPRGTNTNVNFWLTEIDAQRAINSLYREGSPLQLYDVDIFGSWSPKAILWGGLKSGLFVERRKDRPFTNAIEQANFNIQGVDREAQELWWVLFRAVGRANAVIYNIPRMTDALSADQIRSFMAQAKFFRAYSYFYLVKEFGDVPLIDFPFTSTAGMEVPRTPAVEIYRFIEADLLAIMNDLPNVTISDNNGRITRPLAQALLARIYLQWAGYPMNGGNEMYARAAAMARQVIGGGSGHALIHPEGTTDDLNSAFNLIRLARPDTPGAVEIIMAREYNQGYLVGNNFTRIAIDAGALAASRGFFAGGTLFNSYLPDNMLINSFHPDDIRGMERQIFFNYLDFTPNTGEGAGEPQVMRMGFIGNWAWYDESVLTSGVGGGSRHLPAFRFAEQLLIAAEGLARTGDEAAARGYLNQVRRRAGLADNTDTGNALIHAILTERLHEMPLEFRIWDDIRRTRLYPQADGMHSGTLSWVPLAGATIKNKPEGSTMVGAIPEFALLWPIPLREMSANPTLVQNPGWN